MPYVNSSAITRIEWSGAVLSVWFKSNKRYDFPNVPEHVYRQFLNARSHGEFYNDHIKDRY